MEKEKYIKLFTAEQVAEKERVKKETSNFVFDLRNSFRETQQEFAARFNLSAGMVASYEKGRNLPPLDIFAQFVKLAGEVPYKVLGIEEPMKFIVVSPEQMPPYGGVVRIPNK